MKRTLCALLLAALLPACATLRGPGGGGTNDRSRLWNEAHAAFARDSFPVAAALFQRLASEHPRSMEGRESRFYLGVLALEPRYAEFSPARAGEHLNIYLSLDTAQNVRVYRESAAQTLLRLSQQLRVPCEERIAALRCAPTVVERRVPGAPAPAASNGVSAAEVERLRNGITERDAEIARLREELARIRNTLVPRRP